MIDGEVIGKVKNVQQQDDKSLLVTLELDDGRILDILYKAEEGVYFGDTLKLSFDGAKVILSKKKE